MNQYFFTFEGGEGTGKTTISKLVLQKLKNKGYQAILTREPGGLDAAEKIREIIFENKFDLMTEAMLFATARRMHLVEKIIPNLKKQTIVLCDRYIDSSIVYQGYTLGNTYEKIQQVRMINELATENLLPNKTFFLDVPVSVSQERVMKSDEINRFDQNELKFHEDIYDNYLKWFNERQNQNRIIKINGMKSIEEIANQIVKIITEEV